MITVTTQVLSKQGPVTILAVLNPLLLWMNECKMNECKHGAGFLFDDTVICLEG